MTTIPAGTAAQAPVYFPSPEGDLFGVLTRAAAPNGASALLLMEAGRTPALGRNRMAVRIAACLSDHGYHAFRLDYLGVGDSGGDTIPFRLDSPRVAESRSALVWLDANGMASDVLVVGACFGARTALAFVPDVPALRAVALISPPVRDARLSDGRVVRPWRDYARKAIDPTVLRRLVDRRLRRQLRRAIVARARQGTGGGSGIGASSTAEGRWVSPAFLRSLTELVDRRVPVLLLYGEDDFTYADFASGRSGPLGALLERAGELVSLVVVPGEVHGFASLPAQRAAIDGLGAWLREFPLGGLVDETITEHSPGRAPSTGDGDGSQRMARLGERGGHGS